jgi:hypothetical protein
MGYGYLFASVEWNPFSLSEKMNKPTTRELPICKTSSTAISSSTQKENKIADPEL